MVDDDNGLFAELGIDLDDPGLRQAVEDEEEYERVVATLVRLREAHRLSQREVADALGTTQPAVSRTESCVNDARYSTLQRYARAVGARLRSTVVIDKQWTPSTTLVLELGRHGPEPRAAIALKVALEIAS